MSASRFVLLVFHCVGYWTNLVDQAGKMKLLGMDIKTNMGVRMDGSMFDD